MFSSERLSFSVVVLLVKILVPRIFGDVQINVSMYLLCVHVYTCMSVCAEESDYIYTVVFYELPCIYILVINYTLLRTPTKSTLNHR